MERGPATHLLTWLLLPAAAALAGSALGLAERPYTGIASQGDRVARVEPGSPGDLAGLMTGDRLLVAGDPHAPRVFQDPLARVAPGRPVALHIERGGAARHLWLVPRALPAVERRMQAAQLAVAAGFVLLGAWVWSERRDRLTRTFLLLCLAFAWLLAPPPHPGAAAVVLAHDLLNSAVSLFLPALFVHFFALFPESRHAGRRLASAVRIAYAVATLLFVLSLAVLTRQLFNPEAAAPLVTLLLAVASLWFAAALLFALGLFARSTLRSASFDARRRLRVALAGTVLGAGPLALMILVRNLWPGAAIPGERAAVLLTLLVPASFAWAVVVHNIFDFRVALRAGAGAGLLAVVAVAAYVAGESLASGWTVHLGAGIAGGALALLTLTAALAGPARPWLRSLGDAMTPMEAEVALAGEVSPPHSPSAAEVLDAACRALLRALKLDACFALAVGEGEVRCVAHAGPAPPPRFDPALAAALPSGHGPVSLDDPLDPGARESLEAAGARWLLPIGFGPSRAVLLLGRRLAGSWLSRHEARELERFADHLAVTLENAELRRAATSHGALDRELREAGAIQAHLLPRRAPVYPTFDCAAAALSSEPVGGDYYDFVEVSERDFTLAVGDAAGKGVPAALVLAGVQARFRNEARRGLGPGEVLNALNRELVGLEQPEKFVGLLCARVEGRRGRVWFANAGLTPPLVRRRDGRFEEVTTGGVLLGVSPEAAYPDVCVEMGAGDVAVLYTDGLTEARRGDELFGVERVREVLGRQSRRRAADIVDALLAAVRAWADPPLDDLTVVVLKQLTDPVRARPDTQNALKWAGPRADVDG